MTKDSTPTKPAEQPQDNAERGQSIIGRTQELMKTGMGWSKAMEQARKESSQASGGDDTDVWARL